MVGFTIDIFSAIEKFIEFRKVNEWVKLLLSLFCSFWLSKSFTQGAALIAHRPGPEALGMGLVAGATMATVIWRRSPLTRGLLLALPADEAREELQANTQVIERK